MAENIDALREENGITDLPRPVYEDVTPLPVITHPVQPRNNWPVGWLQR